MLLVIALCFLRRRPRSLLGSELADGLGGATRPLAIEACGWGPNLRDLTAVLGHDEALALFGPRDQFGELGLGLIGADRYGALCWVAIRHAACSNRLVGD